MPRYHRLIFALLCTALLLLFVADIFFGSIAIPATDVWAAITGKSADATLRAIVLDIRLIKALVALIAGVSLSVSGLQMQTMFRNPLAGPYILGVSAGASFGVALFTLGVPLFGISLAPWMISLGTTGAAWAGAACVMMIIVILARRLRDVMVILILGMMLSAALSAVVEILQYLSNEAALKSYVVWTMGSLGNVTLGQLATMTPIFIIGTMLSIASIKGLNAILLGETSAMTVGINIVALRRRLYISTTLLAGTITAFCGPIGFIGLAAPHIARMILRTADHRTLLPASALVGCIMLLVADLITTTIHLPVNTITALMGIPVVAYIVIRRPNQMQ